MEKKARGRPKRENQKTMTKYLNFRMSDKEFDNISRVADGLGYKSISDYLRTVVRDSVRRYDEELEFQESRKLYEEGDYEYD